MTPRLDELQHRAARVGAWSQVNDVRLFECQATLHEPPDDGPFQYDMSSDVTKQYLPDESGLIVSARYKIAIRPPQEQQPNDEPGDGPFYTLEFTMAALFNVDIPKAVAEPLSEEELEAFANSTGQFALHPYAREFIADMTGRAGLPTLHVGMLKLYFDGPPQEQAQESAPHG